MRVCERGSVRDNEKTLCFIIIQLEFVLMMSMFSHLKCNPACFGPRCLFDLDCRNRAAGCHLQKTG